MKKATLFAFILALVLSASAETVNFAGLPAAASPTLLPNGYSSLDWANFYYVEPLWSGGGAGFKQGPSSMDVAFMGGGLCELAGSTCSASISSSASAAIALGGFYAQNAIVAAGYHSESINVSAYNHGKFVGSQQYSLTTSLQQINFPASWGMVTQLVMDTTKGTVVLYSLNLQSTRATALGMSSKESADANAVANAVGPTAPIHVLDPLSLVSQPGANANSGSSGPSAVLPSAPKHVGPITGASASSDVVITQPNPLPGPKAPKKGGIQSDGLVFNGNSSGSTAVLANAPKHVGAVTGGSASSDANAVANAVGPTAPIHVLDPLSLVSQPGANANSGSSGPSAVLPSAPRHVGPITGASASSDIVITQPNPLPGPKAPKKGGIQSDGLVFNGDSSGSSAVLANAPKHVGAISHSSASSDIVITQPNPLPGPKAPKKGGIQPDGLVFNGNSSGSTAVLANAPKHVGPITGASASSDIIIEGPNPPIVDPTAPKQSGAQPN